MSSVWPPSSAPAVIGVAGEGDADLVWTVPTGVRVTLESVYAEITTAAATSSALLTVRDQSGVVIARKRQNEPIAVSTSGSATWALRLDAEADLGSYLHWGSNSDTGLLGLILDTDAVTGFQFASENAAGTSNFLVDSDFVFIDSNGIMRLYAQNNLLDIQGDEIAMDAPTAISASVINTVLEIHPDRARTRIANGATFEVTTPNGTPLFVITN